LSRITPLSGAVPVNILRNYGYQVVEAEDGAEAMAQLEGGQSFDLLFTDVVLPGAMNGMDVAARAQRLQPAIRVVFTTGNSDDIVANHGVLNPDAILLSKPYRRAELLENIGPRPHPDTRSFPTKPMTGRMEMS
jgi:CheY-like chemotaxis protein